MARPAAALRAQRGRRQGAADDPVDRLQGLPPRPVPGRRDDGAARRSAARVSAEHDAGLSRPHARQQSGHVGSDERRLARRPQGGRGIPCRACRSSAAPTAADAQLTASLSRSALIGDEVARRLSVMIAQGLVGAAGEQQVDGRRVAEAGGDHQRAAPAVVLLVELARRDRSAAS